MSLLHFPNKFFVWILLTIIHIATTAVFAFLWAHHRDQALMMSIWILDLVIIVLLLARVAIYVRHRIRSESYRGKLEYHCEVLVLLWIVLEIMKLGFTILQLVPDRFGNPGNLQADFAALDVSNQALVSVAIITPSVANIALELWLFDEALRHAGGTRSGDSWGGGWLNRPLVRPPSETSKETKARIVHVQHGSPPEMWSRAGELEGRFVVAPAKPTYDPNKATRRLRTPPPIRTSWNQWYITPGDAGV